MGSAPKPFRYRDLGTMATISRFRAVASIGRLQIAGLVGWLMWLVVHLVFLTGFKNRVAAVANWAVAFLGRGRRQRTITKQQVLARARALAKATDSSVTYRGRSGCTPAHPPRRGDVNRWRPRRRWAWPG